MFFFRGVTLFGCSLLAAGKKIYGIYLWAALEHVLKLCMLLHNRLLKHMYSKETEFELQISALAYLYRIITRVLVMVNPAKVVPHTGLRYMSSTI